MALGDAARPLSHSITLPTLMMVEPEPDSLRPDEDALLFISARTALELPGVRPFGGLRLPDGWSCCQHNNAASQRSYSSAMSGRRRISMPWTFTISRQ